MKRILHAITGILLLASACSEAEKELFHAPDAIYFRMPQGDTSLIIREDTVIYSFAFDPDVITSRDIYIPVEIVGLAANKDREYIVEITNIGETKEGLHYEAVNTSRVLPAGKTRDSLRVTFFRAPDMREQARKIGVTIRPSGDFIEGVAECLFVAIQVSDILERPKWWNNAWNHYFGGTYDPQIYRAWIEIWGGKGDISAYPYPDWWSAPRVLTAIIDLKRYFDEHEVYYYSDPTRRIVIEFPS
ncbi:MAG: DUF4843 domain-containing protein [Odoribacteraceae bacterium]|jgi:hypothetical protein|nr:DUF4843 domain-containing protein [Odoribacteraceae bacterium]